MQLQRPLFANLGHQHVSALEVHAAAHAVEGSPRGHLHSARAAVPGMSEQVLEWKIMCLSITVNSQPSHILTCEYSAVLCNHSSTVFAYVRQSEGHR